MLPLASSALASSLVSDFSLSESSSISMSATSMLSTVGSMGFSSSGDLLLPFFPSVGVDGADPSATSGRPDVRNDDCGAVTGPVFAFSASF